MKELHFLPFTTKTAFDSRAIGAPGDTRIELVLTITCCGLLPSFVCLILSVLPHLPEETFLQEASVDVCCWLGFPKADAETEFDLPEIYQRSTAVSRGEQKQDEAEGEVELCWRPNSDLSSRPRGCPASQTPARAGHRCLRSSWTPRKDSFFPEG